jgi:hypothetical protein
MDTTNNEQDNNENVEGYKVPGDGNAPNSPPAPGNRSFEENPHHMTHKSQDDIPGKEFNIGDKAFFDSSKEDFVKTVSSHHHAQPGADSNRAASVDLSYKKPDGDR